MTLSPLDTPRKTRSKTWGKVRVTLSYGYRLRRGVGVAVSLPPAIPEWWYTATRTVKLDGVDITDSVEGLR